QARIDRHPVEEDGAGAALPFAASFFGAGQAAILAQHVEQPLQRMDPGQLRAPAVEDHRRVLGFATAGVIAAAMIFSGVAGISRRSWPAWRSALITAGAGPSIGISPTPLAPNGPCLYGCSRISTSIAGVSSVVGMM